MKKHQVNRSRELPQERESPRRPKASKIAALGTATLATLALTLSPTIQGRQVNAAPLAPAPIDAQLASRSQSVEVTLVSGVDAIRWESQNITSAAAGALLVDAANPGSATGPAGATAPLVGHNVGPLGVLPAGIQLIHPVPSRRITSSYGWRNNPTGPGTQIHIGQDYAISCGSPVYASADGVISQSAWAGHSGLRVTVDHGSSVQTGYSHNSRLMATVGQRVKRGQVIALSGTTGNSTGCHLHFEVIVDGRWNDPRNFLPIIPGQPNPMIDSRGTTIAAGPIRNTGDPRTENNNGHDIDVKRPEAGRQPPTAIAPDKEHGSPAPSDSREPGTLPKPKPTEAATPTDPPAPETSAEPERTTPPPPSTTPTPTAPPTPSTPPPPSTTPTPTAQSSESTETQSEATPSASTSTGTPGSYTGRSSGPRSVTPSVTPTESP